MNSIRRRLFPLICGLIAALAVCVPAWHAHAGDLKPTLGEDGIYHFDWYHQSFLEMQDDLDEALADGKVLMVKFDQTGCIYCEQIALEILTEPAINTYVRENFVVVQLDLYGNRDVTDFDGETLPENKMAQKWGVVFTPTIYFIAQPLGEAKPLPMASNAVMPGAFKQLTFLGFLQWVREGGYDSDEHFQKYFGRRINEIRAEVENAREFAS